MPEREIKLDPDVRPHRGRGYDNINTRVYETLPTNQTFLEEIGRCFPSSTRMNKLHLSRFRHRINRLLPQQKLEINLAVTNDFAFT